MARPRAIASGTAPDTRVRLIRAVRAACRSAGLSDDDRRAIQQEETGKRSLSDMTPAEMTRLLARLNRGRPGSGPRTGQAPHTGKVRALWWTLYWLGAVRESGDRAIDAFVRRQAGVSALRFLDHRGAATVIEALKDWATRDGVDWPAKADPVADRRAVLAAVARKLDLGPALGGLLADELRLSPDPADWREPQLDAAIRHLGRRLREDRTRS